MNLVLKGENKIDIGEEYPCFGIITYGSLTISGDGTLNISVNSTSSNLGIQSNRLTVNSGTLKITTGKASVSYGTYSHSDFTLANGSVTITTADENGEAMGIIGKNLAVNGGNLKITTGKAETSCGMYAQASIKVTNGVVDITAGETLDKTNGISLGMYCEDRTNTAILITGGTVTVATKGSVGDIVQAILPAPNFSGYTGCTPVGSTSSDGTGAVSYVANNNVSYKYVKIYKDNPADKGWTIDNAGNLTISTDAGMTDWVKNGRDTHNATLKTATINEAVTAIPAMAFDGCKALTTVSASGAKNISGYAFNGCSALATVNFPKVETIVAYTFIGCDNLENAAFPAATDIYGKAFGSCTGLATLQLPAAPPDVVNANAFEDCPATRALLLVDADGRPLTGTDLVNAQAAYKAEADGDATDNLWYGWKIDAPPPTTSTVTSVTVTPTTVTKKPGSIQKFTAVVNGENSPAQTVKWTVEGTTGSSIDGSGELIVVSTEPDGTFIVRATSTVDTSKSSTATVTVSNTPAATTYTITLDANGGSVSPASITTGTDGKLTSLPTPSRSGSYRFDGWFTAASGGTQVTTGTVFTSSSTIYAHWTYTGGGGSDSGGGSSSGGGTVTPPTPPATDTPSKGESTVTVPVDKNGNASITVTDKNISDAIAQAKKDTAQGQPISVSIKVETDKAATQITATLPKTVQETLISNKVDSVTIASNTVTMSFSQTAIAQMNGQAKADITITAAKVDTGKLTGDAKALIGSRPMYDFTVVYGNNKSITDFGSNTVSIAIPYTLGKGETAGNIQAIYVDDNGKATVITNSSYDVNKKAVIFTTSHFSGYGVGYKQTTPVFNDIANHWAKADIEFVASRSLLSGTGDKVFSPNTAMTRGMFVTALGRLSGVEVNSYKTSTFTDVKADAYYAPYVAWAASKNIVSGTSATTFAPDQSITRQEMAVIMQNYAKVMNYTVPKTRKAVTFADNGSIAGWAADAVKSMQMAGVIMGKDGNKFDPTGTATRAEVAAVLHRYVELVIDRTTAQGLDVNDSGKIVYYENGKLFTGTKIDAVVPDTKKYIVHKIVKGDTLWDIAVKNKCTVAEIVGLNDIKNPNNVPIGTELKIPQK